MSVQVRYHPMELAVGAEYEIFEDADHWIIHEDNTLELRKSLPEKRYRKIAHVHPERWDSVKQLSRSAS